MKNKGTVGRILKYIGRYKILLFLSILMAAISALLTLYLPTAIGNAIDGILGQGNVNYETVKYWLAVAAVCVIITAAVQWIMNVINNKLTYGVAMDIRRDAGRKLGKLPLSYIDSRSEGETVSRIISDVDQFTDGLLMGFTQLFTGVLTIVGTIGFMLVIDPLIALGVIVLTPMTLFIAKFIATKTYSMFRAQAESRGKLTGYINEAVSGGKLVRAFGRSEKNAEEFSRINDELGRHTLKAVFFSSLVNPTTRFATNIIYAAVALCGSYAALGAKGLTVGGLSCLLAYATQYAKPFNEISGVVTELQGSVACAQRVFELLDAEIESADGDKHVEKICGNIEFDNVSFSYAKDKKLIENLNLNIKAGQKIAIVGHTGCGKTTLINLLMRFYDVDSGEIRLEGVPIKDIPRKELRSAFGMVLQDTYLFRATVRENIAFGNPDATDEEIIDAARRAHADPFIRCLPNGYDTVIGDGAAELSQGQKQLLAIARVMVNLPPMLILDEATSSIDTRTEMIIQDAFNKMTEGRTAFIVAHRLSTVRRADVILYMEHGRVKEKGSHSELLAAGGGYADLYTSQFK